MSMWLLLFFSDDRIVNYHCACVSNTMQLNKGNNKITELHIYVTEYGTALTNILPILFLYLNTVTVTTGTFEP
jgi:hypothetical protein